MIKKLSILPLLLFSILLSCSTEPREIDYGNENCEFCSMTIMDKQFGTEMITNKGKIFTFCSIECMVWEYVRENKYMKEDIKLMLAKDFIQPNELINVEELTFVKSIDIPSPMGASLSAFDSKVKAEEILKDKTGEIFTWKELTKKIK